MASKKTVQVQRTTAGIKNLLFDEIELLRSGDGDVDRTKAIVSAAGRIMSAARLEMDYVQMRTKHGGTKAASLQLGD